jgi:FOG: TPR repeat
MWRKLVRIAALFALGVLPLPVLGNERCVQCHPAEVRAYAASPMGNSFGRPKADPGGSFFHRLSGTRYVVTSTHGGMRQRMERSARAAEYEIGYFIGSGNVGRSYLVQIGGRLFQSPVSYYSKRRVWDMSPGYEGDAHPDFQRPITADCLFCHTGGSQPVPGTINRYQNVGTLQPMSCERCHGPVREHLQKPLARNIINPRKLPARARDSVCEQCHLSGEARIVNPGRQFADFQPGMDLESVFTVYVREAAGDGSAIKVVSHAEQLAMSRCATQSGERFWCGSCHNPHTVISDARAYYRNKCLECHASTLSKGSSKAHQDSAADCTGCHMPSKPASDAPHSAFTDHRIVRFAKDVHKPSESERLVAWREAPEALRERNLGLAYVGAGERNQSAWQLNEGFRLLAEYRKRSSPDPAVDTALGMVLIRKKAYVEAARLFESAARVQPDDAMHQLNLGVAWSAAGNYARAVQFLERALEIDSGLEEAYWVLAETYRRMGQEALRKETLSRLRKFMPQRIDPRLDQ